MVQPLLALSAQIEGITVGQIITCITVVCAIMAGVSKVKKAFEAFKKTINGWVVDELKPEFVSIKNRLDALESRNERQDMESVKNYLVLFLADIERNEKPDEVELLRFEEQFKYYTSKGGNSYIHRKYNKLKEEGKL